MSIIPDWPWLQLYLIVQWFYLSLLCKFTVGGGQQGGGRCEFNLFCQRKVYVFVLIENVDQKIPSLKMYNTSCMTLSVILRCWKVTADYLWLLWRTNHLPCEFTWFSMHTNCNKLCQTNVHTHLSLVSCLLAYWRPWRLSLHTRASGTMGRAYVASSGWS